MLDINGSILDADLGIFNTWFWIFNPNDSMDVSPLLVSNDINLLKSLSSSNTSLVFSAPE